MRSTSSTILLTPTRYEELLTELLTEWLTVLELATALDLKINSTCSLRSRDKGEILRGHSGRVVSAIIAGSRRKSLSSFGSTGRSLHYYGSLTSGSASGSLDRG